MPDDGVPLDRAARRAAAVLVAFQVLLVWAIPYPVGTDLPGHVAILSILGRSGEPEFARYFDVGWTPTPYMVANGLVLFFSLLVGMLGALKIVLSLYFVLLPMAAAFWVRSVRPEAPRGPALLWGAAFAFNNPYFGGSLNHLWGLMTALAVLGAWWRLREGPAGRRRLLLAAGLAALYFCHFTPFALAAAILLAVAAADPGRRRLVPEVLLALALPAALFAWFSRVADLAGGIPDFGNARYGPYPAALVKRLAFPFGGFDFRGDFLTQLPTVVAYAALAALGLRAGHLDRRLGIAVGTAAAAVLLLPHTHLLAHPIACRIAHVGLFLFLPALAPPRRWTLALLVAGAVLWNGYVGIRLVQVQRGVADYLGLADRIPPAQPVFPLFEGTTQGPESRIFSPYEYLVGYYHAEKGGVSPNIPDRPRSPWATYILYKDPRYKSDSVLLADFDLERYAPLYPYVLYRGSAAGTERLMPRYRVVERRGDAWLLHRSD